MDSLSQIIKNLKKEEIRSFKLSTKRYQRSEDAKIAVLFDKIREEEEIEDADLVRQLFPASPGNMNAYYRLRNRLKTELERSLLDLHNDMNPRIALMNLINLANIFTFKSQYAVSVYYLKKAEKLSEQNGFYDLLEIIYNELINLSLFFDELDPLEYQEKRRANLEKNEVSIQVDHAIAAIWYRLKRSNFSKNTEEISGQIDEIMKEAQISSKIYELPRVKLRIYTFIRDLLFQNRNFKELENYLIRTYKEFEQADIFNKSTHNYKLNLLTWITNTLIVNRKWEQAEHYTNVLLEELNRYNRLYYDRFIWTYYQSLVTTYMSSGKLNEAIELLEHIKELPAHKGVTFYDYGIHVNLALCYFFQNKKPLAIKTLAYLLTKEMYPKLSVEFQLSLSILESILHYESSHPDYVEYKTAEIKRQFRALFKKTTFQEDKAFLKILNLLVTRPAPFQDKKVLSQIDKFIETSTSLQVGSSKHIDYTLWLKAKRNKTNYYQDLMNSLQT